MSSNNGKKLEVIRVTVDLPKHSVTTVDEICRSSIITRRKWFFDAMTEKLERDKSLKK
jgi:metal-responsive CopG/Arc/MetJ family transcriptional regulator